MAWPDATGLLLGIACVLAVHFTFVIPYYYCLYIGIIKRPFVQIKNKTFKGTSFFKRLKKHIKNPEGFLLLAIYLSATWMLGIMPKSYYVLSENNLSTIDVILQLVINDIYQTIAHLTEHKIKTIYIKSHKMHHKHTAPTLFDAFDGHLLDTMFMILLPLYSTQLTMHYLLKRQVSVWSYMLFGSIYANYLCLIHSEYQHPWDSIAMKLGIGTPADHHVHHKLFNKNYGHLFMYWDKILGTYADPRTITKHFNT